jgi:hypothetical protein
MLFFLVALPLGFPTFRSNVRIPLQPSYITAEDCKCLASSACENGLYHGKIQHCGCEKDCGGGDQGHNIHWPGSGKEGKAHGDNAFAAAEDLHAPDPTHVMEGQVAGRLPSPEEPGSEAWRQRWLAHSNGSQGHRHPEEPGSEAWRQRWLAHSDGSQGRLLPVHGRGHILLEATQEFTPPSLSAATFVILSDRFEGLVVALGSLFMNSPDREISAWLIGDLERGSLNGTSLADRLHTALKPGPHQTINVMDIEVATKLLEDDGISPLWKWPEFGSQGANQDQDHQPVCLMRPEKWDYDNMHHNPFNMLRFYLPYLGPFRGLETLFFADDDISVQRNIKELEVPMGSGMAIAATCNGWLWNPRTKIVEMFQNGHNWLDAQQCVSYLGRDSDHGFLGCLATETESTERVGTCQSHEYAATVTNWTQTILGRAVNFATQPKWNFGLSRFNLTLWRQHKMTEVFDSFMHANYDGKVIPETSLAYGLGIPYFAFSDRIKCWNDLVGDPAFVDGMGYIEVKDIQQNGLNATKLLSDAIVIHWSGHVKPFDRKAVMDPEITKPFDDVWKVLHDKNGLEAFVRTPPAGAAVKEVCEAAVCGDPPSVAMCMSSKCSRCLVCVKKPASDILDEPVPSERVRDPAPTPTHYRPPAASCGMFCRASRARAIDVRGGLKAVTSLLAGGAPYGSSPPLGAFEGA